MYSTREEGLSSVRAAMSSWRDAIPVPKDAIADALMAQSLGTRHGSNGVVEPGVVARADEKIAEKMRRWKREYRNRTVLKRNLMVIFEFSCRKLPDSAGMMECGIRRLEEVVIVAGDVAMLARGRFGFW